MKTNRYYQEVLGREFSPKHLVMRLFLSFSTIFRPLLQVFTRSCFGERYFSLGGAIFIALVLFSLPFSFATIHFGSIYSFESENPTFLQTIWHNIFWYAYLVAFLYFSIQRRMEFTKSRSCFDFSKYSKASGFFDLRLMHLKLNGKTPTPRQIEVLIEPALFFLPGVLFIAIGQSFGYLLLLTSLIYSAGYYCAYRLGDDFILEQIDIYISGEEFERFFVEGLDSRETRGFRGYGRPSNPKTARKVADIINDENAVDIDFEEVD